MIENSSFHILMRKLPTKTNKFFLLQNNLLYLCINDTASFFTMTTALRVRYLHLGTLRLASQYSK